MRYAVFRSRVSDRTFRVTRVSALVATTPSTTTTIEAGSGSNPHERRVSGCTGGAQTGWKWDSCEGDRGWSTAGVLKALGKAPGKHHASQVYRCCGASNPTTSDKRPLSSNLPHDLCSHGQVVRVLERQGEEKVDSPRHAHLPPKLHLSSTVHTRRHEASEFQCTACRHRVGSRVFTTDLDVRDL